jgi:hypothetical protein
VISKFAVKMLVMNPQEPGQKPGPPTSSPHGPDVPDADGKPARAISAVTLFIVVLTTLLLTGGAVICVSLILSANAM